MHRDAKIIEDTSTAGLLKVMQEKMPDLIVAGGKTKFLALKTRTPFLDINHGRSHPYAGYEGMVTFARQLDLTVNNPSGRRSMHRLPGRKTKVNWLPMWRWLPATGRLFLLCLCRQSNPCFPLPLWEGDRGRGMSAGEGG
nr:nitrogenase component 1 [Geotalea toluenoxydans]